MMAVSKRTTSIVDISEIEDDDDEVAAIQQRPTMKSATTTSTSQEQQQQQQQRASQPSHHHHNQQQQHNNQKSGSQSAQLYLFHEDLHPQQRISSLLASMSNLQPPQTSHSSSRSADTSPGQTLARSLGGGRSPGAGGGLPAIDYSPAERSLTPAPGRSDQTGSAGDTEAGGGGRTGHFGDGSDTPTYGKDQERQQQQQPEKANLGTLTGVYFPCVQNIFGVILFIRMVWIVGTAGVPTAFALVFVCCCVTFTTSISLSAIATNGIVPAGGSYFMISRSLGPECGGAVGTLFFLGTTVAGAMYITGAVEIMLNYMAPSWGLFGDFQRDVNIMYHNIRVYGTLLLIVVGLMVWIGVKFVSKLAPIALFCVLFSIFSIYMGIFINYNGRQDLVLCVLGDRLVTLKNIPYDDPYIPSSSQQMNSNNQPLAYQYSGGERPSGSTSSANSSSNPPSFRSAEEQARYELRRTKALCTQEKLRYIFCPHSDANRRLAGKMYGSDSSGTTANQQQQDQQPLDQDQQNQNQASNNGQSSQQETGQADESQLMRDLFKKAPNMANCDPYFSQNSGRIHLERAVPGIASGILFKNLRPRFRTKGTVVSYDDGQNTNQDGNGFNYVFVDITTTFTILISIYFPSCTGILAGSNRSGDLADAQRSIPRGTIAAQLTTSFVYLSSIILFGATFNNLFIRDKFGESMGGQLAVTQIAWPEPYFILVGGLLSTLGASLQSLVGAPRILQGIARDDVIPCFHRFAKLSSRGEPETAILFTLAIAELAVLIGNLDFIAPILTISLVMCYFFINLACTLHSLLGSPNWRPRFKYYHWSTSLLGCILCLFVMIVSSWVYFLVAILLATCIYKYIEFSGAKKEWGDGKQGLALSAATYNLLRLGTSEPHTKNWRPQLLLFCKLKPRSELEPPFSKAQMAAAAARETEIKTTLYNDINNNNSNTTNQLVTKQTTATGHLIDLTHQQLASQLALAHPKLLTFASQLKAGQGLTLVSSVIEGDYKQSGQLAQEARQVLQDEIQRERVRGIADVVVSSSIQEGLCYQVQTAGLGGLKHNTVIVGWPEHWRKPVLPLRPARLFKGRTAGVGAAPASEHQSKRASFKLSGVGPTSGGANSHSSNTSSSAVKTRAHLFIDLMRNVQVSQNALLVVKGVDSWPESCDKLGGTIDVWWIVNDGGLLMLLPHLLRQHRTWKACQLRIFTIAQASDNSEQMRDDLTRFLYHLRITAKVDIVVMRDTEISDYAYERTLMMEQRGEIIKRLSTNRKQSILLEQEVDGGRLIRFRIRKPSIYDFEETVPFIEADGAEQLPMVELGQLPAPAAAAAGPEQVGGSATAASASSSCSQQLQSPTSVRGLSLGGEPVGGGGPSSQQQQQQAGKLRPGANS
uniref:Solute carrier family 12 member 5 n=1 Tax=Aceria tosichella TaxID=561515 RepID=A0A6G1S8U8_9ACAR